MRGSCYCGSVSYSVQGCPALSAYCHCTLCQRLTGCPFVHTIHFEPSAFTWTHKTPHENHLDQYTVAEKLNKTRYRCKTCGVTVASRNSNSGHWSVWGSHLERDEKGQILDWEIVKPTSHMFYGTRVIDVVDGLGKWEGYENKSDRIDVAADAVV
ncbi:hypothetical protein K474DRAFT_1113570 [Panus rudis PR-1116 ss-1]|nr:hypothetical protein K474DRAFT_1113570 [Panus rudis PR-1116 ss-1]